MISNPLLVSEIVREVLEYLYHDPDRFKNLFSAVQVSKQWARQGLDILWRRPRPRAFLSLSSDQQQWLANHTIALYFDKLDSAAVSSLYALLEFPKLREVSFRGENTTLSAMEQYIRHELTHFTYDAGWLKTGNIMASLQAQCPQLQHLDLDYGYPACKSEHLVTLLQACPGLRSFRLGDNTERCLLHLDVIQCLMGLAHLDTLHFPMSFFNPEDVQDMIIRVIDPFPRLTELGLCNLDWEPSQCFYSIKTLKRLQLRQTSLRPEIFEFIASFSTLEELSMSIEHSSDWQLSNMLPLKALRSLKVLEMAMEDNTGTRPLIDVADQVRPVIFSSFPKLERLTASFCTELSIAELVALGQASRSLKILAWPGKCGMHELKQYPAPLFPQLREMWVDRLKTRDSRSERDARYVAHLLRSHCPQPDFTFSSGSRAFTKKITRELGFFD